MNYVYLTIEQAIEVHALTVEKSGGGTQGALEIEKLESVLEHIQNDNYYPTLEEKLAHLFFCSCKFHCFEDGKQTNRHHTLRSNASQQRLPEKYRRIHPRS
ncbi:Fic family protein [Pelagicoccus sp. SDUM812002]|uniref:Fic family protein n=1 Tax=Pelagicoccus sp. SDUM812002 TaxID=3041266 RepID=UPI0031F32CF5